MKTPEDRGGGGIEPGEAEARPASQRRRPGVSKDRVEENWRRLWGKRVGG